MPIVADIAHDLCNLVSNFNTRLYLTQKSPARLAEHLIELEQLVNYLDALVGELMTISRSEFDGLTQELKPVNLNEVVARALKVYQPVAQSKNLSLTFEAAPNLSPILADPLDIVRVVVNILYNTLNFMSAAGTITLTTAQGVDLVLLTVRDTGVGIGSETLPHIFERFYRDDEAKSATSGTGLGLTIVQGIVEKYGGHIEVESAVGQGCDFKVFLPNFSPNTIP